MLGASLPKIAEILETNIPTAKKAEERFISELSGLKKLKTVKIPNDADRGYFIGLDGRRVPCDSKHLMLAGYLQNGEALCMKYATLKWIRQARREGQPPIQSFCKWLVDPRIVFLIRSASDNHLAPLEVDITNSDT